MSYDVYELQNSLNWDLVARRFYRAPPPIVNPKTGKEKKRPIPEIILGVDRPILMVGIKVENAPSSWWLGASATQLLAIHPSTTSIFEPRNITDAARYNLRINLLNLVRFPRLEPKIYYLSLRIPYWIQLAEIEVWKYSGLESDSTEEMLLTLNYNQEVKLHRIEEKVDDLVARLDR
jgi:hypothetical protein